jgi:hypothetical protein
MDYDGLHNAMTNEENKQPGLLRRFGLAGAVIVAACLAASATVFGYGVDSNIAWTVTANTTIAPKYCMGTIQAGTGSSGFFTITVPAVTGFPANCVVDITNGDTTTLRGKGIAGLPSNVFGCANQAVLWPGQTCKIGIVNGAWTVLARPGRWHMQNAVNFFTDFTNGTDTKGATDGLAPGASAFKSVNECLNVLAGQLDWDSINATKAICNMAAATTDTQGVHASYHNLPGAQGGLAMQVVGAALSVTGAAGNGGRCEIAISSTATYAADEIVSVYGIGGATGCNGTWHVTVTDATHLTLQGTTFGGSYTGGGTVTNGSAFSVVGNPAAACYFGTVMAFFNVYFKSTTNAFVATDGCVVQIQSGNVFGGGSEQSLIQGTGGGRVLLDGDIGIASGAGNYAIQMTGQSVFLAERNGHMNLLPGINPSYAAFAHADTQGQANFAGVTINLNGNTVTGKRCEADTLGLVNSGTGTPNSYFPGNADCTTSVGGQAN